MARYAIVPERSTCLLGARSSMGPIVFEAAAPSGWLEASIGDDRHLDLSQPTSAHLVIDLRRMTSGNDLYDAEIRRRIEVRRHPEAVLDLGGAHSLGEARYGLTGDLTFHGTTRVVEGTVEVESVTGGEVVISGQKLLDIRDFSIPAPSILMLKIYPEVEVRLIVAARVDAEGGA